MSVLALLGGCASTSLVATAANGELRSTMSAVYEAVGRGDEARYRQLVQLPRGDVYPDALTTTMFESIRLHQAVEAQRLKDREDASDAASPVTDWRSLASSRSTSRPSYLAAVDYRDNAGAMIKAIEDWTFTVRGDRATIDQLADLPGAPTFRRVKNGWQLVPTPWDTPADSATYRLMVASERRLAAALATARAAVADGTARSVEDVNAILRKRLAEPTTKGSVAR